MEKPTSKFEAVIGLEVHAQLRTKSKMFATEKTSYGAPPNTYTTALTLGHPGTLPRVNQQAMDLAIKMGLACHTQITQHNLFARKNYYYADLPKGYQITQIEPICHTGYLHIAMHKGYEGPLKKIRINRIHLEEDTGKSIHDLMPGQTLLDFNRAGTPLIEIVSEPDLRTPEEAYHFLREIRRLVRYLNICDGNMEEGSLRCDANISLRPQGAKTLGTKVEIKNMNSMRHVMKAIAYEIERQTACLTQGERIVAETRSFDINTGKTYYQRKKEGVNDYRYFIEPDLPPIIIDPKKLASLREAMPLLPAAYYDKFKNKYGLPAHDASMLAADRTTALYFEKVCQHTPHYKAIANWMLGPIRHYLNTTKTELSNLAIQPQTLAALVKLIATAQVSFTAAVDNIWPQLLEQPEKCPIDLAAQLGVLQEKDEEVLQRWVHDVINQHAAQVTAYQKGKKGLLGFFIGAVMQQSEGRANPQQVKKLLIKSLNTR